jgi:hypothetical protein
LKGYESNVMRNRKITALLKEKGRINYDKFGDLLDWKVQWKENPIQAMGMGQTMTFAPVDRFKTAQLEWRGYASTDALYKKEKLMNRSEAQIINLYSETTKLLLNDIKSQFQAEFYIDGNATGNDNRMHGIESFMSSSGASATAPTGTPNDSYSGLTCGLADYGGTWTGNWPDGNGDASYDFWSPLLVDYTSAVANTAALGGWNAATKTWANTCKEALRYAILFTQKNRGLEDQLDAIFLNTTLYRQYLDTLDDKERITIQKNASDSSLIKLGFRDVINFDGVDVTSEFDVPSSTGYGFNIDKMELNSLQSQLFVPTGPDWDIATSSWRYLIDVYGNMRFNPRNFCKFKNYS